MVEVKRVMDRIVDNDSTAKFVIFSNFDSSLVALAHAINHDPDKVFPIDFLCRIPLQKFHYQHHPESCSIQQLSWPSMSTCTNGLCHDET